MKKTSLGQYLYSERIRAGYEIISDYFRDLSEIPISQTYYRDIETGRKKIKADTAERLCDSLKLDKREFYFHLLKDLLPESMFSSLVKPIDDTSFKTPAKEIKKLNDVVDKLRKVYSRKILEEPHIATDKTVEYLNKNYKVLPLIHYIYMKEVCTFRNLEKIIKQNSIVKSLKTILEEFELYDIAKVDFSKKIIRRYKNIFRIPPTVEGMAFKDKFFLSEIKQSISSLNREKLIGPGNTFIHSAIICIKEGRNTDNVSSKMTDLLAELEVEQCSLDEKGTSPYFVSIVVSNRDKYES